VRQQLLPLFPAKGKPNAYRAPKAPTPKAFQLHLAVANYLRAYGRPEWLWSHFPAGEKRDPRTAAKLKAMGVQRGWPDFLLIGPGGRLHALELKRRGEVMTEDQETFAAWCSENGVPHVCADHLGRALATLSDWGVVRVRIACTPSEMRAEGSAGGEHFA
jgi:hypothetical protein